jgi:hypothetical protein
MTSASLLEGHSSKNPHRPREKGAECELEGCDKGFHESVESWDDLLENLRGNLTFGKQLSFAQGVSRFHGQLLL